MKNIKQETYKGYSIKVDVQYKEDVMVYSSEPSWNLNAIKIVAQKTKLGSFEISRPDTDTRTIEFEKNKKEEAYVRLNDEVDKMIKKIKKEVDKEIREKEMTDGLPESLLKKEYRGNDIAELLNNIVESVLKGAAELNKHSNK